MSAFVAEPTPASDREGGDPAPRHPADETRRPVDACDVVSFLLEREHLAAAFELLQDVVEGTSDTSGTSARPGAPAARADAAAGRLEEARDLLERYFGDRERFPARDLRAYAEQTDVPLLQASVREQESRARVAEYDAELAAEDLERARLELEAAELERRAAEKRRDAAGTAEKVSATENGGTSFLNPALNPEAFADPDVESRVTREATEASSSPPPPLPPPSEPERRALNALVADYLDRRGYRATRLTLRDEAVSDFSAAPVADGLRRAVHRASRLDASDVARDELRASASASARRAETLERALAEKAAETASLAARVAEKEATASEQSRRADALLRQLEDARRSIAGLETARDRSARDFERAAATAKHLERDLESKTREFKRALSEKRRGANERETTENESIKETRDESFSPLARAFEVEASAEEEATVRALADALPRVASATLVAERHELLPLFARAATRHKVAASRRESLRALFDLVKRPERAHRDALAATALDIARASGEERSVCELVPALRAELAHKKQERRVAACACVGSVAKDPDVSEATRWRVLFPALRDAFFSNASSVATPDAASDGGGGCPSTRSASLRAFAAVCDGSSVVVADAAREAESFLAAALADASERVAERAAETAATAATRWRVRAGARAEKADETHFASAVSHLETFAKGLVATRVAAALGVSEVRGGDGGDGGDGRGDEPGATLSIPPDRRRDADRWRARFYLRLFARTLETVREEAARAFTSVQSRDVTHRMPPELIGWFDANAAELARLLARFVPEDDADAASRRDAARAARSLCLAAGAGVARERVVAALTDQSGLVDAAASIPIALAAALPHCGPGALEAFLREYVARESARDDGVGVEDAFFDDAARASARGTKSALATAERAIRRAVSLCDDATKDGDETRRETFGAEKISAKPNDVRDAIMRVLETVATGGRADDDGAGSGSVSSSSSTAQRLFATTLLGAAAAACPSSAAARVVPALGRLAAGPCAFVAARAAAALVRVGDAHATPSAEPEAAGEEEDVSAEALRLLDFSVLRRDARVAAAFAAAVRDAAETRCRATDFPATLPDVATGQDAFWDGVASRLAATATAAFGGADDGEDAVAATLPDIATRRRLASLCFGAARGILEADEDARAHAASMSSSRDERREGVLNPKHSSRRRDALVPALRALARPRSTRDRGTIGTEETHHSDFSLLDASDRALAETMLRDEDWRLVAAAEAVARTARETAAAAAAERERAISRKKSYAPSVSASAASAAMSRAMFGAKRPSSVSVSTSDDPASPAAPSVDFATLVGEAAPTIDAAPASADEASGAAAVDAAALETGDAPDDRGVAPRDAPPPPPPPPPPPARAGSVATSVADATDGKRPESTPVVTKEKEKRSKEKSSVSSKMFSAALAMPSAPKIQMPSMKNPFGK